MSFIKGFDKTSSKIKSLLLHSAPHLEDYPKTTEQIRRNIVRELSSSRKQLRNDGSSIQLKPIIFNIGKDKKIALLAKAKGLPKVLKR